MKEKCAIAALDLIQDGMTIGLGGGSTVALLLDKLIESGRRVDIVTPSADIYNLCLAKGLVPLPLETVSHIDVVFDGCDELDEHLNALKSCGGIHTREKIVAAMADDYILLADEEKFKPELAFQFLITLEVIRSARAYVEATLIDKGAVVNMRQAVGKAGHLISDDGHYLIEAHFVKPMDMSLQELSQFLDCLPGVIAHSLFYQVASKAIIAGKKRVDIISR